MIRFTAKRLPQHQGPAAWNAILDPQQPPELLENDIQADFAVIGAGFAGLSAARRLLQLQPGSRIVVIEAGRIAEGASGRNSGFMIDLPHELSSEDYAGAHLDKDRKLIHLNRQAIAFAKAAVEEYGIDFNFFDPAGKVNGAAGESAHTLNLSYASHLKKLGEPYEMLDSLQMKEMTGSQHYRSGLYTPGTTMLQPAGYIRGLCAGLRRSLEIYENSPVIAIAQSGRDWRVITTRGAVVANRIILANNGHLESFGFERGRLIQLFLYASMTVNLDAESLRKVGGEPRWGITPSDPMGTTMRKIDTAQGGNRIVTRTCATLKPNMVPTKKDVMRAAKIHWRRFEQRFPQLSGVRQEYSWAGHLCLSRNGVAVVKKIESGIFTCCVQNGLGTTRGTLTGIAAAELAVGLTSEITHHFSQEPRPLKLPLRPFSTIGGNVYLRYKEWQAKEE